MRSRVGQTLCSGKGALDRIASEQSTASIVYEDDVSYGLWLHWRVRTSDDCDTTFLVTTRYRASGKRFGLCEDPPTRGPTSRS